MKANFSIKEFKTLGETNDIFHLHNLEVELDGLTLKEYTTILKSVNEFRKQMTHHPLQKKLDEVRERHDNSIHVKMGRAPVFKVGGFNL